MSKKDQPLSTAARAAVLQLFEERLLAVQRYRDDFSRYLVALVDDHLFGEQTVYQFCSIGDCDQEPLPGEPWCGLHDPARNGNTAAALDRLEQDIKATTTGDQLLAEVKQEIAATNARHTSEHSDASETSDLSDLPAQTEQIPSTPESHPSVPTHGVRSTDGPARLTAALQRARDYVLDAHRKQVPISAIVEKVTGYVDMSRSEADTFVFKTIKEGSQPDNTSPKSLDLTGGGSGALPADREAKKREDAAWYAARNTSNRKGEALNEQEWRKGYRERRTVTGGSK